MDKNSGHIRQWKHNRSLLEHIPPAYPDWIATITFYTALQAVDALFEHHKIAGVTSHEARNKVLSSTHRYLQIHKNYMPLYMLCRTVRYLANPSQWVPIEKVESQVLHRLYAIEQSVQKLMGIDLKLGKVKRMAMKVEGDG